MSNIIHENDNGSVDKRTLGILGRVFIVICIGVPAIIIANLATIWFETGRITYVSPDMIFGYFFAHPTSEVSAAIMFVFFLVYGLMAPSKND
ncbi:hypothetical protein [Acidithiobacillus thiooxidans]|uniref:hypothetical protein n=1 Tax=Acidithiobacillus thiooxidans TaxID=930 RepID=UPI000262522B|nr:hypothetical protein [Acidithiobacillus thiooxidans]MDD2750267.1 hypothetical protein [Acidithiobacillus sp.]